MLLFDILALHQPDLAPARTKLHLATSNGVDDPLDVFFAGEFEDWQSWQGQKNFERKQIVAMIKLPGRDRWLFAGAYEQLGREWVEEPGPPHWSYKTAELEQIRQLAGRLVVGFRRSGRASYRNAEGCAAGLEVLQLLERPMAVGEFPGFHDFVIPKSLLDLIALQQVASWKGALSNSAGVYVITDTATGKLYVGSATGEGGIWARWSQYAVNGHGGNKDLKKLLKAEGADYARHFQYAVLEIADTHTSADDVLARESHWKRVLASREHGYNAN